MSGTRFARTGRFRLFACLALLLLLALAIYHSSQQQLDETRERCEHQQDTLNERLQLEEKFKIEKNYEQERKEQMEVRHKLEEKISEMTEIHAKLEGEERVRYEKLERSHSLLQNEHQKLIKESAKHRSEASDIQKKLQLFRSEFQKEKTMQTNEIILLKDKYEAILKEKNRLEVLSSITEGKADLHKHVTELEAIIKDYQFHCNYKPNDGLEQIVNKSILPSISNHVENLKSSTAKSFKEQLLVSPGLYHISVKETNKNSTDMHKNNLSNNILNNSDQIQLVGSIQTDGDGVTTNEADIQQTNNFNLENKSNDADIQKQVNLNLEKKPNMLTFTQKHNASLILNSVENFQILPKPIKKISEETETQLRKDPVEINVNQQNIVLPLSAPRKPTSTEATKLKPILEEQAHLKKASNSSSASTSSSSILPPLAQPPNQHKIPANVAPIPANFDELFKNEPSSQKTVKKLFNDDAVVGGDIGDIDAAVEETQKNEHEDGTNNNRYGNIVNNAEGIAVKAVGGEDSGAHEIKDHDFLNEQNFNLPVDDDNNFFDGVKNDAIGVDKHKDIENDGDNGGTGNAGDIAVKNHNLLDADNLNNEIVGDQGKEFPDLRLDDGNEEDEDEDDYSNHAARFKGEQAIRH
ncbi:myosin-13 isoform X2 [Teleopsis dalmanni]|uniref:myosin-13 isoform X2 n=1 Tax=Teleopsis dalmanni TaxID=139649 RepID=UPI0018CEA541|nr:myosin-13 isoform X2 [Teleopsis dalmanni]